LVRGPAFRPFGHDASAAPLLPAPPPEHAGYEGYEKIPGVFAKLHPNLTPHNYALLRRDPLFLYSRMAVCDQCFLLLTAGMLTYADGC
jgi:hypothetical protein